MYSQIYLQYSLNDCSLVIIIIMSFLSFFSLCLRFLPGLAFLFSIWLLRSSWLSLLSLVREPPIECLVGKSFVILKCVFTHISLELPDVDRVVADCGVLLGACGVSSTVSTSRSPSLSSSPIPAGLGRFLVFASLSASVTASDFWFVQIVFLLGVLQSYTRF